MHGFVWWSPSHESALLSLPLCPMPYSDRKVHACSEGGSVTFGARLSGALTHGLTHRLIGRGEKVRKKKREERKGTRSSTRSRHCCWRRHHRGSVQHAACLPPSTWPTRGSDPHPYVTPFCPCPGIGIGGATPRHASTRTEKVSRCFQVRPPDPRAGSS